MSGYSPLNLRFRTRLICLLALLAVPVIASAAEFSFTQSTPVGSWAVREDTSTDHKGKQSVGVIKYSVVDKEAVDGETHYWIEMEMQNYKLKKDQRKPQGERNIIKMLVSADLFSESPANVLGNLSKHAKTVIMQMGNNDPMIIDQGGMLGDSMLQALGVQVEFSYQLAGTKTVAVPAGKLSCTVFQGEGSTEAKVVIKKIRVESKTEGCYSNKVPFGLVYAETHSSTNGKPMTSKVELIEFGTSGAKSAITKTPVAAPKMPKLF